MVQGECLADANDLGLSPAVSGNALKLGSFSEGGGGGCCNSSSAKPRTYVRIPGVVRA